MSDSVNPDLRRCHLRFCHGHWRSGLESISPAHGMCGFTIYCNIPVELAKPVGGRFVLGFFLFSISCLPPSLFLLNFFLPFILSFFASFLPSCLVSFLPFSLPPFFPSFVLSFVTSVFVFFLLCHIYFCCLLLCCSFFCLVSIYL